MSQGFLPSDDEQLAALATVIDENHQSIRSRILDAGGSKSIEIVAVSKGQSVLSIGAAAHAGFRMFGENYADELVVKATNTSLQKLDLDWTFQGRLQTNKINRLTPYVGLWQTVDSVDRAQALSKRVPGARVLVQLNLTGAEGRSGASLSEAAKLISAARVLGLDVAGVMGVGPDPEEPSTLPGASEAAFREAIRVADDEGLAVRSLGMSTDFEAAVRVGSTMIRIGSLLFGPRENLPVK
jgi:PLP dependent protein